LERRPDENFLTEYVAETLFFDITLGSKLTHTTVQGVAKTHELERSWLGSAGLADNYVELP
jgi:hypothetical protein